MKRFFLILLLPLQLLAGTASVSVDTSTAVVTYPLTIWTANSTNIRSALDAGLDADYVQLSGSYANPSWITSLANSKITGLGTLATQNANVNPGWINLVIEGDSRSVSSSWPANIQLNGTTVVNVAANSDTLQNMVTTYTAQIHPYAPNTTGNRAALFIWGGHNDVFGGRTAVQMYNDAKTLWAAARADGFIVIASTEVLTLDQDSPPESTVINDFNTLVRSDRTLVDYLFEPQLLLPDPSDTDIYADGTHYTTLGKSLLQQGIISLQVNNYAAKGANADLTSITSPTGTLTVGGILESGIILHDRPGSLVDAATRWILGFEANGTNNPGLSISSSKSNGTSQIDHVTFGLANGGAFSGYKTVFYPAGSGSVYINGNLKVIDGIELNGLVMTGTSSSLNVAGALTVTDGTSGTPDLYISPAHYSVGDLVNKEVLYNASGSFVVGTGVNADASFNFFTGASGKFRWLSGTTNIDGTGAVEKMSLLSNGNLSVSGIVMGASGEFNGLAIAGATPSSSFPSMLTFGAYGSVGQGVGFIGDGTYVKVGMITEGGGQIGLTFRTAGNTERLRIGHFGNVDIQTVGATLGIKSGSNAKAGTFTLTAGAATVSNTSVTANSVIQVTLKTVGGTRAGNPDIVPTAGVGFVATGAVTDTSVYNWVALEVN